MLHRTTKKIKRKYKKKFKSKIRSKRWRLHMKISRIPKLMKIEMMKFKVKFKKISFRTQRC